MDQKQKYTITAFAENKPGVLFRTMDLFLRRKINIESLTASETERDGISRFMIVVNTTKSNIEKIVKQMYRIIEVTKVFESLDSDLLFREITLINVSTKNAQARREVEDLARLSHAKIVDIGRDCVIVEQTGSEKEIDSLLSLLRPFGIKEFVRSGRIAVVKGERKKE